MDKFPRKWEDVSKYTKRLKVPGGWIVASKAIMVNENISIATVYVPDPMHEWELEGT